MINNALKVIGKHSAVLIKDIYKDFSKPAITKIGLALETVFDLTNTILLPVKLLNEKSKAIFENHMKEFGNRISNISRTEITPVHPEIGLPILDKLITSTEPLRSDLFLNLLLSASSKKTQQTSHPRFVHIIEQLSQDEAMILVYISYLNETTDTIPYVSFYVNLKGNKKFDLLYDLTLVNYWVELSFPENLEAYMGNLCSLGLLEKGEGQFDDNTYKDFAKPIKSYTENMTKNLSLNPEIAEIRYRKGFYKITELGRLFIKGCEIDKIRNKYFSKSKRKRSNRTVTKKTAKKSNKNS